jgi:hypothetical protein
MDQSAQFPGKATRCVFCARPVAATDACPLLPSSHWACCACEAPPAAAGHDAA